MVTIIVLVVLLPLVVLLAIQSGKRNSEAQKRRVEEYRKSPESHILHLND
jgi:hypothetical protein